MTVVNPSLTGTYYGSFNASGQTQYLTLPSNAAFQFGTGNFTIEFWVKFNNVDNQQALIDMRNGTGAAVAPVIYLFTNSYLYYYTASLDRIISSQKIQAGLWYHIAVVRSSGVTTMFINGNKTGSTYTDANNYIINSPWIGRFNNGVTGLTLMLSGLMSNLRIIKGTAIYTDNFVPSTDPLTTTSQGATASQVSLLTLQNSTIIDNGTGNAGGTFTITNVGSVTTTALTDDRYGTANKSINDTPSNHVDTPIMTRKSTVLFQNTNVNGALAYTTLPIPNGDATTDWAIFDPIPIKTQYYIPTITQFWS